MLSSRGPKKDTVFIETRVSGFMFPLMRMRSTKTADAPSISKPLFSTAERLSTAPVTWLSATLKFLAWRWCTRTSRLEKSIFPGV